MSIKMIDIYYFSCTKHDLWLYMQGYGVFPRVNPGLLGKHFGLSPDSIIKE